MNIRMSQDRLSGLFFCSVAGVGILLSSRLGLYAIHNDPDDVMIGAAFCFLGYVFYRLNCELARHCCSASSWDRPSKRIFGGLCCFAR